MGYSLLSISYWNCNPIFFIIVHALFNLVFLRLRFISLYYSFLTYMTLTTNFNVLLLVGRMASLFIYIYILDGIYFPPFCLCGFFLSRCVWGIKINAILSYYILLSIRCDRVWHTHTHVCIYIYIILYYVIFYYIT